jgi:hypothetical protein
MIRRARRLAAEAVISVEIGLILVALACAGVHAKLRGHA